MEKLEVNRTFKGKEILYIGLVAGKEYKGLGISPYELGGADSFLEKTIEVTTYSEVINVNDILYYNVIAVDKSGNIVYTEFSKF